MGTREQFRWITRPVDDPVEVVYWRVGVDHAGVLTNEPVDAVTLGRIVHSIVHTDRQPIKRLVEYSWDEVVIEFEGGDVIHGFAIEPIDLILDGARTRRATFEKALRSKESYDDAVNAALIDSMDA